MSKLKQWLDEPIPSPITASQAMTNNQKWVVQQPVNQAARSRNPFPIRGRDYRYKVSLYLSADELAGRIKLYLRHRRTQAVAALMEEVRRDILYMVNVIDPARGGDYTVLEDEMTPGTKKIVYRVEIIGGHATVMSLSYLDVDDSIDGEYDSLDALPRWMQERIAVLMMTSSTPPTQEVNGVGRRISEGVFWVVGA